MTPPESAAANGNVINRATPWLLLMTAVACAVRMFDNPGTADVTDVLAEWMRMVRAQGPVETFAQVGPDYPPLMFSTLYALTRLADRLGVSDFAMLKGTILAGTFAGVAVYGLWSRSATLAAALMWTVFISAACLGYQDTLYMWSLFLAIAALERRQLAIAGALLAIASTTKWQPLIVAPFFVLEACRPRGAGIGPIRLPIWRDLATFAAGALAIVALETMFYGPGPIATSIEHSIMRNELTAQALNLNWIVHVLQGGGINTPDVGTGAIVAGRLARAAFWASYLFLLAGFWRSRREFSDFLWFATVGGAAYFTLNTGVHENHLFIALALGFALWTVAPNIGKPLALFLAVSVNVNLIAFYNLNGQPAHYTPWFNGATVGIAGANTAFLLLLLAEGVSRWRRPAL